MHSTIPACKELCLAKHAPHYIGDAHKVGRELGTEEIAHTALLELSVRWKYGHHACVHRYDLCSAKESTITMEEGWGSLWQHKTCPLVSDGLHHRHWWGEWQSDQKRKLHWGWASHRVLESLACFSHVSMIFISKSAGESSAGREPHHGGIVRYAYVSFWIHCYQRWGRSTEDRPETHEGKGAGWENVLLSVIGLKTCLLLRWEEQDSADRRIGGGFANDVCQ